jgi:CheY-like chemotaxis protein
MKRILVVEDDPVMRETIIDILQFEGFEVVGAKGGREAIDKICDREFDLIVTDILMPNRDGYDVIHAAITNCPKARILAISGGGSVSSDAYLEMAKGIGAHMVLGKPFEIDELLRIVHTELGTSTGVHQ